MFQPLRMTMAQQQRCRRTYRRRRQSSHKCFLSVLTLFLLIFCTTVPRVSSIEMEVTKDWQRIGENDTIPAGVHVRMDMTTGEKWVKLVDTADDTTGSLAVEVQSDGAVTIMDDRKEYSHDYDYTMMHRTLSKLPNDEQERMGGLPELPGSSSGSKINKSPEYQAMFEKRMKDIWTQRQAELKAFEEEFVIDLPDLLKERIRRLNNYIEDPHKYLVEMDLQKQQTDLQDENYEETHITDIISVLQDLEYHLADVDMTRDFHTLGGWPLLVTMLDSEGHHKNQSITIDLRANVRLVQLHAAWAIGTAIKNTGEFYPYAIEELQVNGETTTALKMLLKEFQVVEHADPTLQQKVIYAMSALLRGNRPAQVHFLDLEGPSILAENIIHLEPKLIRRLLSLVDDVVSDVDLHASENEEMDQKIAYAFAHPKFCQLTLDGLKNDYLIETSMKTLKTIAGRCQWENRSTVAGFIDEVEESWKTLISSPDLLDDLFEMAGETKNTIMGH